MFVDGGAHIGYYTIMVAGVFHGRVQVYAFEPSPQNMAALTVNVQTNRCTNVLVLAKALGETTGTMRFYASNLSGAGSLVARRLPDTITSINVETVRLDDILGDVEGKRVVIKLDIEGGEPSAIRGMRRVLAEAQSVVLAAECNPGALLDGGSSPTELISLLRESGFDVRFVDELSRSLTEIPDHWKGAKGNLFCTKVAEHLSPGCDV